MSRSRQDVYRCDTCGNTIAVQNSQPPGWWRMQLALRTDFTKPEHGQPRTYDFCGPGCVATFVKRKLETNA